MFAAGKLIMGNRTKTPVLLSATSGRVNTPSAGLSLAAASGIIGQLQVVIISTGAATLTAPAGWTEALDTSGTPSLSIFWRVCTADDASAQAFTFSVSQSEFIYFYLRFADAKFDAVGAIARSTTTSVVAPSITAKKGLLYAVASMDAGYATHTAPAGMSLIKKQADGSTDLSGSLFGQTITAGSTGTRTLLADDSSNQLGVLFSIKGK